MVPIKTKDIVVDRNFQSASQEIDALKLRVNSLEETVKTLKKAIERLGSKV